MRLSNLLQEDFLLPHPADCVISGLALDSRQVQPGHVFFAIKGIQSDGRQYIDKALSQGAKAVLMDAETPEQSLKWQSGIPLIPIYQLSKKLGKMAARFYGQPAKALRMIGVTGTSGKTSCTHFFAQALQELHIPCGIIGTLGSGFYGALGEAGLTTPDAVTLQATLQQFVNQQAKAAAMEVSSHSIDQGRINSIEFDIGIFTNLTQDHLDYHGDMPVYAAVKRRFLAEELTRHIILNADDTYGNIWIKELSKTKPVFAYGLQQPDSDVPFVNAHSIALTGKGITAGIQSPWGEGVLQVPLIGQFNLSNSLAVLTALCVYGVSFNDALSCLTRLKTVPGRMQTLGGGRHPLVVVDYAHKPDALEKVLQALRMHTKGKLICVFGCGGERDKTKRPVMAKAAEKWADKIIVTNDNPRHENPEEIVRDIMQGFAHTECVSIELNRSKAIKNGIQCAAAQDCVLIAGKGAEHYQQFGDEKFPFDDVEEVNKYLAFNGER